MNNFVVHLERQDKGVSSGLNFKPSRLKTDKRLAFVTTNLHLQRLKVIDGPDGNIRYVMQSVNSVISYILFEVARVPLLFMMLFRISCILEHVYDIVTFGAPSAHSMKYSKGGLRRLLGNLKEAYHSYVQLSDNFPRTLVGLSRLYFITVCST